MLGYSETTRQLLRSMKYHLTYPAKVGRLEDIPLDPTPSRAKLELEVPLVGGMLSDTPT